MGHLRFYETFQMGLCVMLNTVFHMVCCCYFAMFPKYFIFAGLNSDKYREPKIYTKIDGSYIPMLPGLCRQIGKVLQRLLNWQLYHQWKPRTEELHSFPRIVPSFLPSSFFTAILSQLVPRPPVPFPHWGEIVKFARSRISSMPPRPPLFSCGASWS